MLHIYIVLFEVEKIEIHAVEYKPHIYHVFQTICQIVLHIFTDNQI